MKTLDRKFDDKELELIARLLSQYGGDLAEDDEEFIGSKRWKEIWDLQEYFNKKHYEIEGV